jgi:D-alanyl-D-alanine carboxypeptidase/D-alanyl-D-alanine-endopeptidase (penicillin-binding protein 4)
MRLRPLLLALTVSGACQHAAPPAPAPTPVAPPIDPRTAAMARFRTSVDSMLADPQWSNAHWGVLVVDPGRNETLYTHNAGKLFMPASNMKIVTSSVALTLLGADYRWRTSFATRGRVSNGTLDGDLIVVGRGDPTVSDHMRGDALGPLRDVADSLAAHGIKRIRGRIVAEGDAFPGDTHGYGWDWDDFTYGYGAGVDELLFNEGYTRVVVRGADAPGGEPTSWTTPVSAYPPLKMLARTVTPTDTGRRRSRVEALPDTATGGYVITGTIAPHDSVELELANPEPDRSYLAALREALALRGVAVTEPVGRASASRTRVTKSLVPNGSAPADTLFHLLSPPLRAVLPALMKPSQNQIAEIFLRTLGYARTGVGDADSGRRVVDAQMRAWGVTPEHDVVVRDGSGLSRHDYVTPWALVKILTTIRADTAFRAYYDALPIAGVDGTIRSRMRGTPAEGNVHAKTGTVDKARSLSGYVTTADGRQLVFSFLCNNYTVPTREVERVQDAIAARLAAMGAAATASAP